MLAVVRHGRTPWNDQRLFQGRSDIALDSAGRAQIEALVPVLRDAGPWFRVISSPLTRARQSAEILARELHLDGIAIVDELIERDFGVAEGMSVDEALSQWPDADFPGSESVHELGQRAATALRNELESVAGPPARATIVVAHGVFLRHGIASLTGNPWPRLLNGDAVRISRRDGTFSAEPLTSNP